MEIDSAIDQDYLFKIYSTTSKPIALFYINTMKHMLYVNSNLFKQGYWK